MEVGPNPDLLIITAMKEGIHPNNYRVCAFKDMSTGDVTLIKSAANSFINKKIQNPIAKQWIKMELKLRKSK